jgi:hypothetical protein
MALGISKICTRGRVWQGWNPDGNDLVIASAEWETPEECSMAKVVVQCQYTGHYIFTGVDAHSASIIAGGHVHCPYCDTDHVWTCSDARPERSDRSRPQVRQAS